MRVFLDENMPRPLRRALPGHEVSFVEREGWKGKGNGELLGLVERAFDVILTSDGSMQHQNALHGRELSLVVLPTNDLTILRANALALRDTLDAIAALNHHVVVTIDWKGRRTSSRLDMENASAVDLPAVPFFDR